MNNTNSPRSSLLLQNIGSYARKAGRVCARSLLLLYYVMMSSQTPRADKIWIASTLAYLVLPIDLISAKRIPIIGWVDEAAALTIAIKKMSKYITPEIEMKADSKLDEWFGANFEDAVEIKQ